MSDVLAVNIGSSSVKFALYTVVDALHVEEAHVSGLIEGLEPSGRPRLSVKADGAVREKILEAAKPPRSNMEVALEALKDLLLEVLKGRPLVAVAHRIVHGGDVFCEPVVLGEPALAALERLCPLAPLHQPHNLAGVRACRAAFPEVPQVGCFDTAFHKTMSELESHFGLPRSFYAEGVRRYGFHGLSYEYVSTRLMRRSEAAQGRLLMAHLGSGSSLCAAVKGLSQASSMGFSALDGLLMGTRSGSIDPGVLLYLLAEGWTADRIGRLLYKESGLLGVSGISADMRRLRDSNSPDAHFAIELYAHRIIREAGALIAVMGGLDAIAFTGGIGEHDAALRASVCEGLAHLGVRLLPEANAQARGSETLPIQDPASSAEVWVIPTDEGRVAAESALRALKSDRRHDLPLQL